MVSRNLWFSCIKASFGSGPVIGNMETKLNTAHAESCTLDWSYQCKLVNACCTIVNLNQRQSLHVSLK